MVRRNLFVTGMILVLGLTAATVSAQGLGMLGGLFGGGGLPGGGLNLMLLRMPEVQTELKLTEQQKTDLTAMTTEVGQKLRDSLGQIDFQGLMNASQEERQKMMDDMRKKLEEGTKGIDDKVTTILNKTQADRLHELVLQSLGALALTRPEVSKGLGLSADQLAKITKIQADARPKLPTMDQNQDPQAMRTAMQAAMQNMQGQAKKAQQDCLNVLTDDQMLTWTNMCGKTFKFPANGGFGQGMRGGQPQQP